MKIKYILIVFFQFVIVKFINERDDCNEEDDTIFERYSKNL